MTALRRSFSIHGTPAHVFVEGEALAEAAELLLRGFSPVEETRGTPLEIRYRAVPSRQAIEATVPAGATELLSQRIEVDGRGWECTIRRDGGRLFVDLGPQGLVVIDPSAGSVDGHIVVSSGSIDGLESLLRFGVIEILRSRGLYSVHAAAADRGGRGVLIVGASGRGKTTSLLALLRAGYRVLSDDHPLLRETEHAIEILSFPTKIDVTDKTVALIPELSAAESRLRPGATKRWFEVSEIFPGGETTTTWPVLLLFPEVIDWPRTAIDPLPKARALEEILRQGLVVLDREVARRQMAAYSRLVRDAACYRLRLGEDFLDLPARVDRLLGEHA